MPFPNSLQQAASTVFAELEDEDWEYRQCLQEASHPSQSAGVHKMLTCHPYLKSAADVRPMLEQTKVLLGKARQYLHFTYTCHQCCDNIFQDATDSFVVDAK